MAFLRRSASAIYLCDATHTKLLRMSSTLVERSSDIKTWQEIPGPSSLPFIGQYHHYLPGGSLYNLKHDLNETLYKKYGPIVKVKILGVPYLVVHLFDADSIETILRTEDIMPNRPLFKSLAYYRNNKLNDSGKSTNLDSTGLITEQDAKWKSLRSKVNPIMLQPKSIKLYTETIYKIAEELVARIKFLLGEKHTVNGDIRQEITNWSLESVALVALGQKLNLFDPNLGENSPERRLVKSVKDVFYMAEHLDLKPNLWRYFSTPLFKKAMKVYDENWQLTKYFVERSMKSIKNETSMSDDERSIVQKLVDIDERTAILMAGDSLFAGVDTTSHVAVSIIYFLANNPDKQKRLREELSLGDPKQPYLKACIKEALRIMPILPAIPRTASKDYDVLGYRVPKDSILILNHEVLVKLEQHFPRPNEFIPERWIVDKTDPLYYGNANSFVYNPFGFGTRSCVGRRIAQLQLESFTSEMIRNFHVYWNGPPAELDVSISIFIKGDLPFIFKKVD